MEQPKYTAPQWNSNPRLFCFQVLEYINLAASDLGFEAARAETHLECRTQAEVQSFRKGACRHLGDVAGFALHLHTSARTSTSTTHQIDFVPPYIMVIAFCDWYDHSLIEDDSPSEHGHLTNRGSTFPCQGSTLGNPKDLASTLPNWR